MYGWTFLPGLLGHLSGDDLKMAAGIKLIFCTHISLNATLCFRENGVSPKIRALPSGTFENFINAPMVSNINCVYGSSGGDGPMADMHGMYSIP